MQDAVAGLWGVLRESIELRQAPFVLWMQDLSQPDAFLGYINVLPILSIVVMFVQQQMMPKSPDPQQQQTQKIMGYTMPLLMGFLFWSVASGVALYFVASMFLGIVEQQLLGEEAARRRAAELERHRFDRGDHDAELGRARVMFNT